MRKLQPDTRPRIVLLGARGQLGTQLAPRLARLGDVICLDRSIADLSRPLALRRLLRQFLPDIVVNAAAYTAVDRAESEARMSRAVNAIAPAVLARTCRELGAFFLHISTDYVFDGTLPRAYHEFDAPAPLNQYGRDKLEGEEHVLSSGADCLIARTAMVYAHGSGFANFASTMLRLAEQHSELSVVADQWSNPCYAPDLADALCELLRQRLAGDATRPTELSGVLHVASPTACSRFGFVTRMLELAAEVSPELSRRLTVHRVHPVNSRAFPLPARRPAYPVLDTDRLERVAGIRLPEWDSGLRRFLEAHAAHLTQVAHGAHGAHAARLNAETQRRAAEVVVPDRTEVA